ncbi:hypothetical protein [Erythrobacter sp. WG]|uniref:hypothetical protein n=1 Tax=Erythrobacter sp. WG TaxID=2985510 RepID=UPI0022715A09|nr:hypothetical protein [Erythrobacter sp. WG]MCX9147719.1 hypothetical protein [Erythrobacter sp. WG]
MSQTSAGAIIVRHIEELEAAVRYARGPMSKALGNAVAELLTDETRRLGWNGDIPRDLNEQIWFAPNEWRTANDSEDYYDLFIELEDTDCIDGGDTRTWIGTFCGFAGAGIRLGLDTNALGPKSWKSLLRKESDLIDQLLDAGFLCDAKKGELAVLMTFDRDALAQAFADDDFDEALLPLAQAIERIVKARPLLDELVGLIRQRA